MLKPLLVIAGIAFFGAPCFAESPASATQTAKSLASAKSLVDLLKLSQPADWRALAAENLLVMDIAAGRIVIELAPQFAPKHVANIKALVKENYFDGLAIIRAQDNYVVQWGDPDEKRPINIAQKKIMGEYERNIARDLDFTPMPDKDGYAPKTGFSNGWPVARKGKQTWLTHCYGMVGAGRDTALDSGSGSELYAMIATARNLDRNVTMVGRVVQGIELLSAMPRGTGNLGFYEQPEQRHAITRVRMAADLPANERPAFEMLRTDSALFKEHIKIRRNQRNEWYRLPAGYVDVCGVPAVVRKKE